MRRDRADAPVRLGDFLAHLPQRAALRFGLGDDAVRDQPRLQRRLEQACKRLVRVVAGAEAKVDQHRPLRDRVHRAAGGAIRFDKEARPLARHEFERADPLPDPRAREREQVERGSRAFDGEKRGAGAGGTREKPHGGRRDDAQRAFGPDHQAAQIIAGVVLAQPFQPVPDRAVGQHRLQPQTQLARVAVAQDVHAARIGRQHAADPRRAFGGERQGKQPILGQRGGL